MYLSTVRTGAAVRGRRFVAANVVALGLVSCVTDVSAEMVAAVLPAYLVLGMHLTPAAYGAADGLYTGATALTRLLGGHLADRYQRRKLIAGVGYGLSTLARAGLVVPAPALVGAALAADRLGKGLRTPPRDAIITLSTPAAHLGRAFGLHRAMDSAGAFAGPLVAAGVLVVVGTSEGYDAVFVASFCLGLLGVVLFALLVRDRRGPLPGPGPSPREALRLLVRPGVGRCCLAAGLLGLGTIGDGFVYLILQRRDDLHLAAFPLLAAGVNLAFLLLATPLGLLADRFGRRRVLLGGYALLMTVYLLLATGRGWLPLVLALYGGYYAATDGTLMALAGPLLPAAVRTTGLALVQTAQALAYLCSSVLFGLAWQWLGVGVACMAAAVLVGALVPVSARLVRVEPR